MWQVVLSKTQNFPTSAMHNIILLSIKVKQRKSIYFFLVHTRSDLTFLIILLEPIRFPALLTLSLSRL